MTRHHLSKFLLRQGRIYQGKTTFNAAYMAWVAKQTFDESAQRQVLADYREAVELAGDRVARLTAQMRMAAAAWEKSPLVVALQACGGSIWSAP